MGKQAHYDLTIIEQGEQLVNQQIMESYQSGVIDHDVEQKVNENQEQH